MAKTINLTMGYSTIVDDEDYEWLSVFRWRSLVTKKHIYAIRGKSISIHREIMNAPKGLYVDHIDYNTLNNQRSNLRIATPSQSIVHRRIKNPTGYIGVHKHYNKWCASIWLNGTRKHIGLFDTPEEAAKARDDLARQRYGEFEELNFP